MGANARRGGRTTAALLVTVTLFTVAACSSKSQTSTSGGAGSGTVVNTSALGTPNKATGTPIKIGFVNDGKTDAIDQTNAVATFNSTVKYLNEYRGGLNGHVLVVDACSTQATPTGATTCAVQLANDKVAAALVPLSAEDSAVFNGLSGSGIPYFTYTAASSDIILKSGADLLTNPIGLIAAPAKLAKDAGINKAGYIIIDVPAATGPITAIAKPIFKKAGVTLDVIPISPQVADMTPQIQQAISAGDKEFAITGTDEFVASALKALKQLGFEGQIVLGAPVSRAGVKSVPGGIKGVLLATSVTSDPTDKDVQLYNAILATYNKGMAPDAYGPDFFATAMAFDEALTGNKSAVDAASISATLSSMPKPLGLPMGGGITYKCGSKPVPYAPNICSTNVLKATLDAQGQPHGFTLLNVAPYMVLG